MQVLETFVPQLFPSGAFARHRILLKPADAPEDDGRAMSLIEPLA
ncbi:MAG TPA: hypothetical protein VIJ66_01295 [Solirubrobacteraceae bacterium]